MRRRFLLLSLICLTTSTLWSQDYTWWNQVVNWDGITHWSRYMITQPGYQGPNSLPVPRTGNGTIDSINSITATLNMHNAPGDNTQNLALYANLNLVKDVISFDASWVPYERYWMSKTLKAERHVFPLYYYDTQAIGEVNLNTNFQLLRKWRKHIHLALRVGYRFPCGSGFGSARNTDGPGYYFDVSFGKPLGNSPLKMIGMAGFYAWQLQSDRHRQEDAFLFGAGLEYNKNRWRLQAYTAGYLGYEKIGRDQPIVLRARIEKGVGRNDLVFGFQRGVQDFKYTSFEAGFKFNFRK